MHDQKFFDGTLRLIEAGDIATGLHLLAGSLHSVRAEPLRWQRTCRTLREHDLHKVLLEDPYSARCFRKPRGYAGDAAMIDLIYDQTPPAGTPDRAAQLFSHILQFPTHHAVRLRRDHAEGVVGTAVHAGKRVLSLACGHFREGDVLIGENLGNVVMVDQDPLSLEVVREAHGDKVHCIEANVLSYLRGAVARHETFDFVYTLGLTDYLDDRAMVVLCRMVKSVLNPGGTFLLANFMPHHIGIGWLEAVADWHLIYRDEEDLAAFARETGMASTTWADQTGSIAWCEMTVPAHIGNASTFAERADALNN